ncbi:DUF948 domain-containing protein [Thalassiella azotivora]
MDLGDVAGLIAAIAFVALVGFLARPLWKLGRTVDTTTETIRRIADDTHPLLTEVTTTVSHTNEQLVKVDTITTNAAQVATNVSALTALFAATLGSPVVKVAAFTFGVRQAMQGRRAGAGRVRGRR